MEKFENENVEKLTGFKLLFASWSHERKILNRAIFWSFPCGSWLLLCFDFSTLLIWYFAYQWDLFFKRLWLSFSSQVFTFIVSVDDGVAVGHRGDVVISDYSIADVAQESHAANHDSRFRDRWCQRNWVHFSREIFTSCLEQWARNENSWIFCRLFDWFEASWPVLFLNWQSWSNHKQNEVEEISATSSCLFLQSFFVNLSWKTFRETWPWAHHFFCFTLKSEKFRWARINWFEVKFYFRNRVVLRRIQNNCKSFKFSCWFGVDWTFLVKASFHCGSETWNFDVSDSDDFCESFSSDVSGDSFFGNSSSSDCGCGEILILFSKGFSALLLHGILQRFPFSVVSEGFSIPLSSTKFEILSLLLLVLMAVVLLPVAIR